MLGAAAPAALLARPAVAQRATAPAPAPGGGPLAQPPSGASTPADSLGAPPAPNDAAGSAGTPSSASNIPMDPSNYRPVGRPPRPDARPRLTADERDALEHRLKCQCPCTKDVYTCRTTDFSCGVSPAMHADVQQLVAGGYSGDEILAAFTQTYGDRVLMSPPKVGFNLAGYFAPAAVLGTGTVVLAGLMRRWSTRAQAVAAANAGRAAAQPAPLSSTRADAGDPVSYSATDAAALGATPEELARLEAAVRGEPGA
ncbi:hypothetical protein tb265_02640 [Gemmatimonadetes bacterium T265]|nr:hypothetical protein tb265_02640 [Gemmatimonadetes bacterium T265]